MDRVLLISENDELIEKYKKLFGSKKYNYSCRFTESSLNDLLETEAQDVCIIDEKFELINISLTAKKIKSKNENAQILLLTSGDIVDADLKSFSGYILNSYSDELIVSTVDSFMKIKSDFDRLSLRNSDLSESLYRLNVLYNTSTQLSGTLDVNELLNYMNEGLDKSLSFDLTSIISFEYAEEPVLIINSLYDVSEELISALKLRAVLNYKSLFEKGKVPFEIDDRNLKIIKKVKNPHEKLNFSLFRYDNLFAPIDLGDEFFGCIEIFKEKPFTTDDTAYFQTIVRQVSLPLKSAKLYKEIIKKNIELEKLERIKSEFISIVSHELRTPLTPIKNALSIISSGKCGELSENTIKFLNMAQRNVDNLTNIINDILDINKIEAGKMDFNYKIMNIHSVIESVKTTFECVAKEHNINLITDEQEYLPDICADNQRLGQVLTNLVSNAIKFTPDGKNITIKSELKNISDIEINKYFEPELSQLQGNYILVSVIDEGIGIKEENLLKAFDKFTQIENSLTRKVGGTGLGLPIARQLIKAHKGAIWCDSEEGKGSCFHFAIPVSTEQESQSVIEKQLV